MSERDTSVLDSFPDEFLVGNDPDISPLNSGARDIKRVATGTTLEVISDTATEALQNPRVASGVAAGTLLFSTLSSAASPVLAAGQNFSSRGLVSHQKAPASHAGNDQLDEVSIVLQPGESIYPFAVQEAPAMGVSINEAIEQSEVASNIDPSQVTDLPVGTVVNFPLHYKFAIIPEGRDLDWIAAQHKMTLEQLLAVNPIYRSNPNSVLAGAALLINTLTQTTVTPISALRPHVQHHESITPTHKSETPAPIHSPVKPSASITHRAAVVTPKPQVFKQPHRSPAIAPVKPRLKLKLTPSTSAHSKFLFTPGPTFGTGLQNELGGAFGAAASIAKAEPHQLAQNTIDGTASVENSVLQGLTFSRDKHHSHTTHKTIHPVEVEQSPVVVSSKYDIYSSVLAKSGLSAAALHYALSQMEGGSMADLSGDIHEVEQKYGINALYVAAAGCIESACGTSNFARERNNFFGIEAYTDNPDDASTFPSQRANVIAFAQLLHDNYLHKGAPYWGGSGSLHSIYKKYSTSHDSEAHSIAEVMNTLATYADQFNAMRRSSTSVETIPTVQPQPRHESHTPIMKRHTKKHLKKHHSSSSLVGSMYKALAHAWDNPLG